MAAKMAANDPMGHVFDLGTNNSKMATKVATKDPLGQVFDFQLHLQQFLYLIFIYVDIFEGFQWKLSDFFHIFGLFMYSACFNHENNHPNQFLMSHLL